MYKSVQGGSGAQRALAGLHDLFSMFAGRLKRRVQKIVQTSACAETDIGLRRSSNEDTCLVDTEKGLFLVADGMGGAAAGEVASRLFASTAAGMFQVDPFRSQQQALALVKSVFSTANAAIRHHVTENPNHAGMGCTAELLALHGNGFVLGHIGDSRTYRLRRGRLKQLTRDHSLVQQQLDQGVISAEEARKHRMRNVILRAVGVQEELAVDLIKGPLLSRDLFLLCTDGFSDMVPEETVFAILAGRATLEEKASRCIRAAKDGGGLDNITVALVEIL